MSTSNLRKRLAAVQGNHLRMQAKELASGWAAGSHRATRRGSGIEFAGHRDYCPGDDLRHLDRHAYLRHGRLLIREFHTDTNRAVHLVVDATPSMYFQGSTSNLSHGDKLESKFDRATLLAASLATIAQSAGDTLGLSWLRRSKALTLKPRPGKEALEEILFELENLRSSGQESAQVPSRDPVDEWKKLFSQLGSLLAPGTMIFVLSDFLDMSPALSQGLIALCSRKRSVRAAQILSPEELEFPFKGALRLRDPETGLEFETDGESARHKYQEALRKLTFDIERELIAQGGLMFRASTQEPPLIALRRLTNGNREVEQ